MKMNLFFTNRSFFIALIGIIAIFMSSFKGYSQLNWNYISPVSNSKLINPENNVAFRNGCIIDSESLNDNLISVIGSSSGVIDGQLKLSTDNRTLLFIPFKPYSQGESIEVILLDGIKDNNGNNISKATTCFTIGSSHDINFNEDFKYNHQSSNTVNRNVKSGIYNVNKLISYGTSSLPENYPVPEILEYGNPSPKLAFYGVEPKNNKYGFYATIIDNYGTPVFYREWPSKTPNFQVVSNNLLVHKHKLNSGFDQNAFLLLNDKYQILDTLQVGNGYKTNTHDIIYLDNGNHYLMIYDVQPIGMDTVVEGGDPDASVKGFVMQELDSDHNVIFQWRSWDHFDITDANNVNLTAQTVDYVHVNAFDTTADGNILICCRHFDEVTKINRNTGEIIWRFGPKAKNNMFTFTNDTMGFTYSHDIQQLKNGNLTLFDNGNYHNPSFSRAVEYDIDEENLTATLVWEYGNDPAIYSSAKGGSRRLDNGNTLIGWGSNWPIISTEAGPDGTKEWELQTDSCLSYRVMKFDWKTSVFETNKDTIDYGYYNGYEPWPVILSVTNNMDYNISITSASNHSSAFYLETILPVNIPGGESKNMIVNFFPEWLGEDDFEDVLSLNYDGYYSDTLHQRISRQVVLMGTTIDHSGVDDNEVKLVNVSPNPTNGITHINSNNNLISEIRVFNLEGKLLRNIDHILDKNYRLDLEGLTKGMYIVDIKLQNTFNTVRIKVIRE
jgi:arylsulfotransferase ASST/type IX secretion system substrate protein